VFIVKKSIFLVLVLALTLINLNSFSGLPTANKPPFYDFQGDWSVNGWWHSFSTGFVDLHYEESSTIYIELARCIYVTQSDTITIQFYSGWTSEVFWEKSVELQAGFYVVYFARYKTDDYHHFFAVYDNYGNKKLEYACNRGGSQWSLKIKSGNYTHYYGEKKFKKYLSLGQSYTFAPLWSAMNWLLYDPSNLKIKVIRIEGNTGPATVKIYASNGSKFYEQGFGENEQTYIFCNDTLVKVEAYGPAGSKELNISENGLWIVVINSSLTDIYLNQTEVGEENATGVSRCWLNTTVSPSDYHIEYYINNTVNATGVGELNKQYKNGTYVKLVIKTPTGLTKYTGTYHMNRDYNLMFYFGDIPRDTFNLTIKCFTYSPFELTIANISIYDSTGRRVGYQTNVQIAKFYNLIRDVYTIVAEKKDYKTIRFTVDLNESLVYTVVFVDYNTGEIIPWDVETGSQSDVQTYHDTMTNNVTAPPSIPDVSKWYGIHFVVINASSKKLYTGTINVLIYCVKGISRANLWHDTVTIPIQSLSISGEEYWWISEDELNQIIGKQLWEYPSAFKIVYGSKTMTIPVDRCANRYYNLTIYTDGDEADIFGYNNDITYQSGYLGPNPLSSQLVSLLIPLMVFMLVMKMIDAISRRR